MSLQKASVTFFLNLLSIHRALLTFSCIFNLLSKESQGLLHCVGMVSQPVATCAYTGLDQYTDEVISSIVSTASQY